MTTDRNENIRRRGRVYEISVSAGTDPTTGKRIRITRYAKTLPESREIRDRLRVQVRDGIDADPGSVTVAEYLRDRWIPHMRSRVRVRTWIRYRGLLERHVIPKIGDVRLARLRPMHVQSVTDAMLQAGSAPRTALHAHRVLSNALRQAVRWKLLAVNPAEAASPPRPSRPKLTVPSGEEIARLLEAMPPPYRTPTMIATTTGLRLGEVLALRWDVIDLEAARLRVVATLQQDAGKVYIESPKTDRARRTVPIPPMTVAVLRRHRADQIERRLLFGEEWPDLGIVCDRGDGTPIRPMTLSRTFGQIAERESLGAVRFHDLRHAYATSLLEAGVHPKIVSEVLGHSSTAFTMDTYQHVTPTMTDQAAEVIEAALGGLVTG